MTMVARITGKSGKVTRAVALRGARTTIEADADAQVTIVDEATGRVVEGAELVYQNGKIVVSVPAGIADDRAGLVADAGQNDGGQGQSGTGASGEGASGTIAGEGGGNGLVYGLLGALGVGAGIAAASSGGGKGSPSRDTTPPPAPSSLALAAADDSGRSNADGVTSQTGGLTITGTAEAGATVTIRNGTATLGTGTANASGQFSIDVSLPAGEHSLTAIATDAAGNAGSPSAALAIRVDPTAPTAPQSLALAPEDDSGLSQTDGITTGVSGLTITGTAEAGATVTLRDGETVLASGTADAAGKFAIDITVAGGSRTVTATATDAAGNTSAPSSSIVIVNDTGFPRAPTGLRLAAEDDLGSSSSDGLTNRTSGLTITGTSEAGARVRIEEAGTFLGSAIADASGNFAIDVTLAAGTHFLTVQPTDVAGLPGNTASLTVTVDTTAPTVTITTTDAVLVGDAATTQVRFTFNETPFGFEAGDIRVEGGNITGLAPDASGVVWTGTLTSSATESGPITISVPAGSFTDAAGNGSAASNNAIVALDLGSDGLAIDGYVANALVFRDGSNGFAADGTWNHEEFTDSNNNGLRDAGEAFDDANGNDVFDAEYSVVTDDAGNFSGLFGTGGIGLTALVAGNGTNLSRDISTGLAFNGHYSALDGATVVSPLTTLVVALTASGTPAGQAEAQVKAALGISGNVALATFDPFVASTDPATAASAIEVHKAGAQVANILAIVAAAASSAGGEGDGAASVAAAAAAIASQIATQETVDLADRDLLGTVLQAVAEDSSPDVAETIGDQADAIASSLASINGAVQQASGDGAGDVLAAIATAQIVAQQDLADDLEDAIDVGGALDAGEYAGTNLTSRLDDAAGQVETVVPPPAGGGTLGAPGRPAIDPAVGTRVSAGEANAGIAIDVTYDAGDGMVMAGDILRLAVGSRTFDYTLTSADIPASGTSGSHTFTLARADLGADGGKSVTAQFVSAAGTAGPASPPLLITLDTVAQGLAIDPVGDGRINAAEAAQGVAVTLGNVELGGTVSITLAGTSAQNPALTVSSNSIGQADSFDFGTDVFAQLADGTVQVLALQTDAAGNVSTLATRSLVLDRATATPTIALSADDDTGVSSSDRLTSRTSGITITGTAEAGSTVVIKDGATVLASGTANGSGQFSIDVTLAPGTHSLTATATDAAGNTSAASSVLDVRVDTSGPAAPAQVTAGEGPVLTVTEAANGTTITGTTEAGSSVSVVLTGPAGTLTRDAVVSGTGFTLHLSAADITSLGEGLIRYTATATDSAGNVGAPSSTGHLVYTAHPIVDGDTPIDDIATLHAFEDDEPVGITAFAGGGFAAHWNIDTNLGGDVDNIAVQRFAADGSLVGSPVVLQNLAAPLVNGGEEIGSYAFTALEGGGYALAYTLDAPEHYRPATVGTVNGVQINNVPIVGEPQKIFIQGNSGGATFRLIGGGTNGQVLNLVLTPVNGVIEITPQILAQYAVDNRFTLVAQGIPSGQVLPITIHVREDLSYDASSALTTRTATLTTPGAAVALFGVAGGRNETFHVDSLTGTVTGAAIWVTPASGGQTLDISSLPGASVIGNGVVVIPMTLDPNGNYAVPQAILDQLGTHDAQIQLALTSTTAITATVSIGQRPGLAVPQGVFVQTFDAEGMATSDGTTRLDNPATPHNGGEDAAVGVVRSADGGFSVHWNIDSDDDGETDTIAFRQVAANGTPQGAPVALSGFDADLLANVDRVAQVHVTTLENGNHAFVHGFEVETAFVSATLGETASILTPTYTVIGRLAQVDVPAAPPGATFELVGRAIDGSQLVIGVPLIDGRLGITPSLVDQFDPAVRIGIRVSGLATGASVQLAVSTVQEVYIDTDSDLRTTSFSGTATGGGAVLFAQVPGRAEAFHLDAAVGTPTSATMLIRPAQGVGGIILAGLSGVQSATVTPDGGIRLVLPVSQSGDYVVPAQLLAQLGDQDAVILMIFGGIASGTAVTGTVSVHDPVPVPTGVHVQLFGPDGVSLGESVRVDTATHPVISDEGDEIGVSPLAGGAFVVRWATDGNGDGNADGLALQRFAGDGTKQGEIVRLQGLLDVLPANLERVGTVDLQPLANGGYALSYTVDYPTNSVLLTGTGTGAPLTFLVAGIPSSVYVIQAPGSAVYTLQGTSDGAPRSVTVGVRPDGHLDITAAILDSFDYPEHLTIGVSGVPANTTVSLGITTLESQHFAADATLQVEQASIVALAGTGITGAGSTRAIAAVSEGRVESFHIDAATYATANALYAITIVPTGQPAAYDLSGVPNATVLPNGSISITTTPDTNGNIAVPPSLLAQLGESYANVFLVALNLAVGSPFAVSATVREGTDNPFGVYVQTFDASGNLLSADLTVPGTTGNDTIHGAAGDDLLVSNGGLDEIRGNEGDDRVVLSGIPLAGSVFDGGSGHDTLVLTPAAASNGTSGSVVLLGQSIIDGFEAIAFDAAAGQTLRVAAASSQIAPGTTFVGSAGTDIMVINAPSAGGSHTMPGYTLSNWSPGDVVVFNASTSQDYTLTAPNRPGVLVLNGNGGNDTLIGSDGAEVLNGGLGNDRLIANGGRDTLTGGGGTDVFVLDCSAGQSLSLADLINDFEVGTDRIELAGGLTFADLQIVPGTAQGGSATETLVVASASGDILARLANTDPALVTAASFQ